RPGHAPGRGRDPGPGPRHQAAGLRGGATARRGDQQITGIGQRSTWTMKNLWSYSWAAIRRHPRTYAVAAVVLICPGVAGFFLLPLIKAEHHFGAAKKAFAERKLKEAADHLEVCLHSWPDAPTHLLAAQVARRSALDTAGPGAFQLYEQAEEHLQRCEE